MCCNRDYGCLLAVVISIFIGTIIGVLFYFGFIPSFFVGTWIAFGIAVLSLIGITTITVVENKSGERCICQYGGCLLAGIIGTIVTAIIALAVGLTVGTIFSAIITAIVGLFFSLLIIAIILFVRCLIEANCRFRE